MKILIDVDALTPPLTGIGRYTLNLVGGLQQASDVTSLKYVRGGRIVDELTWPAEPATVRRVARSLPVAPFLRWGYQKYRGLRFAAASHAFRDYIYHGPNYSLLPFLGRSVVTIHDLSFLRHPEFHPADRVRFWSRQIHQIARRADHIITISRYQRQEILDLLDVEPDKVSYSYLGCEPSFHPRSEVECGALLERHQLRYKGFTLVVATVEPRKNFSRILRAFQNLPELHRQTYPLVLVGDRGWMSEQEHDEIRLLVENGEALHLGYVDEEALPLLYSAAALFVYPSLYEGFGLPVLEAMASGTAVLCSNVTSLPEVAGEACMLVDPVSVVELSQAWAALLEDQTKREQRVELGLKQAACFSWERCVEETVNIYKRLSDG